MGPLVVGGALIAETKSASTFAVRPFILSALAAALLACRPGADFKVSVRVQDETTGRPIPEAWVLVSARVDAEPERDPPYNRAIAGARDRTDNRGVAVLRTLEGLYWGEEPKDELWKMLSAREPKVERRITLIKEGDLFVFAKDYGVLHHPLRFKGGSSKEVPGLGLMGVKGEGTVLELDPADLGKGMVLTVKMAKPVDPEYLLGSFSPDSLWLFAGLATTGATGTTKKEKAAVYDFFIENLRPLLAQSTSAYHGHMRPESLFDPESREKFINHAPEQVHNHDTTVHEWMTQKALELLPAGYEEVKQYAREIQAGVKAEDEGTRAINHFYNPYDPTNAFPLGESALKWGAIGYPDNPNNEWDWHDAQRYYREGDKAKAYKALGHVLHLLQDLSVPMHTHIIAHHSLFQHSAARYELYFGELAKANGGRLPPIYGMDARAPKTANALADIFDGLAKMTFGRIEGDRTAIDVAAFYKWEKGSMGAQVVEPGAAALDVMGKRLLAAGIEHGSGLMAKYFTDLHPAASVAVNGQDTASDVAGTDAGMARATTYGTPTYGGGNLSTSSSVGEHVWKIAGETVRCVEGRADPYRNLLRQAIEVGGYSTEYFFQMSANCKRLGLKTYAISTTANAILQTYEHIDERGVVLWKETEVEDFNLSADGTRIILVRYPPFTREQLEDESVSPSRSWAVVYDDQKRELLRIDPSKGNKHVDSPGMSRNGKFGIVSNICFSLQSGEKHEAPPLGYTSIDEDGNCRVLRFLREHDKAGKQKTETLHERRLK